jgi:hypothetical protein
MADEGYWTTGNALQATKKNEDLALDLMKLMRTTSHQKIR